MPLKLTLSISLLFLLAPAQALVDYTEQDNFTPQNSGAASVKRQAPVTRSQTKPKRSTGGSGLGIEFHSGLSYGSTDVEVGATNDKVDTMAFEAHFQTRYNVFMAVSYFQAKSSQGVISPEKTGFQKGNPEVLLGFNWLQFGRPSDMATVDLYGGMSFGQSNSVFATERSDQVVGVTTAKRFHSLALGLGYEYRMTGNGGADELSIGNISKLSASLGWVVSHDIRFLVEGQTYSVAASDDGGAASRLQEDVKFSSISPQLQLKLSPLIDLSLGARFRTRRLKNDELVGARLWNLEGAYGSGVFAGLSVNI